MYYLICKAERVAADHPAAVVINPSLSNMQVCVHCYKYLNDIKQIEGYTHDLASGRKRSHIA
jgi:hypothetical protein